MWFCEIYGNLTKTIKLYHFNSQKSHLSGDNLSREVSYLRSSLLADDNQVKTLVTHHLTKRVPTFELQCKKKL